MYLHAYTLCNDQVRAVIIAIVSNVYHKTKTRKVIIRKESQKSEGRKETGQSWSTHCQNYKQEQYSWVFFCEVGCLSLAIMQHIFPKAESRSWMFRVFYTPVFLHTLHWQISLLVTLFLFLSELWAPLRKWKVWCPDLCTVLCTLLGANPPMRSFVLHESSYLSFTWLKIQAQRVKYVE